MKNLLPNLKNLTVNLKKQFFNLNVFKNESVTIKLEIVKLIKKLHKSKVISMNYLFKIRLLNKN
jgi:hypothetical protein